MTKTPAERAREVVTEDITQKATRVWFDAVATNLSKESSSEIAIEAALVSAFTQYFEQNDDAKDAARYRKMCKADAALCATMITYAASGGITKEKLDSIIDAAMQENPDDR